MRQLSHVGGRSAALTLPRIPIALVCAGFLIQCALVAAQPQAQPAAKPATGGDLIPRKLIFGNPDRAAPQISPNGAKLGYLAEVDGVLNVWVGPTDNPAAAKPVTQDKKRGIRQFFWAYTNDHVIYLQDKDGDENWRVYVVDLTSGDTKDLTPFEGVAAQVQGVSQKLPDTILVGLNNRNPQFHDIHKVNIRTGERILLIENSGFAGYMTDDDYNVRFAIRMTPDGGMEVLKPGGEAGKWAPYEKIPTADSLTTRPLDFDKTGQIVYMADSRDRDTAALVAVGIATQKKSVLAEDPRADVGDVVIHPTEKNVQAVSFDYERSEWKVLDKAVEPDFAALKKVADGELGISSRTLDDQRWVVSYEMDDGPVRYYLYDQPGKKATFLFSNRKAWENLKLAHMHPVVLKSRDGLNLVSYLTLPPASDPDNDGRPDKPLPTILYVHGGPWARDSWGYNSIHQWLANRGYAVLSVNYRGSTGFGKNFINASSLEWGGKMHDDLIDAVNWAIKEKITDPAKTAIMGGSYGGYATLVGMTFTPDEFACGVDIVGPSNLVTFLKSIPPYWAPALELFTTRIGDHRTEEGRRLLTERSPLTRVEAIKRPLLIGQGKNDPRVNEAESDQIVKAMQAKHIPVTYILYPDEGHGFARPENRLSFFAVAEAFLAEHLGGRYEPIGEDFKGSSLKVVTGADQVPGLKEATP